MRILIHICLVALLALQPVSLLAAGLGELADQEVVEHCGDCDGCCESDAPCEVNSCAPGSCGPGSPQVGCVSATVAFSPEATRSNAPRSDGRLLDGDGPPLLRPPIAI